MVEFCVAAIRGVAIYDRSAVVTVGNGSNAKRYFFEISNQGAIRVGVRNLGGDDSDEQLNVRTVVDPKEVRNICAWVALGLSSMNLPQTPEMRHFLRMLQVGLGTMPYYMFQLREHEEKCRHRNTTAAQSS